MNNNTLIHSGFDYPLDSQSESLERAYANQPPLVSGASVVASHLRLDGYGMLGQQILQSLPLDTTAKGYGYSPYPSILAVPPFQAGSVSSLSPLDSSCGSTSTSPGSASSSIAFSPPAFNPTNGFNTHLADFSPATPVGFPPTLSYPEAYLPNMYNGRPRNPSILPSSGMPPPSQVPGNPSFVLPSLGTTTRDSYTTTTSHLPSYPFSRGHHNFLSSSSPSSLLASPRNLESSRNPMSPSTNAGYGHSNASTLHDIPTIQALSSQQNVPPFSKTKTLHPISDTKGSPVHVELHAKIDKGFFQTDPEQDWTCYRRNYFSVACSYSLKPPYGPTPEPLYLHRAGGSGSDRIQSFAMCISARVDGEDGKVIDLVQHTPKRDKGPMGRPEKFKLLPLPIGSSGVYTDGGGLSPGAQLSSDYDPIYSPSTPSQQQQQQQSQTSTTFDRIQFKNATANNGKRRAAQQYFHIVVELFTEVLSSQSSEGQWVKVASRISAPMVVRGRSPGHYSDDRRSSSTSMGPGGGSSGDSAGGQRDSSAAGPSSGLRSGISGLFSSNSSQLGGGGYQSHRASQTPSQSDGGLKHSQGSSDYGKASIMAIDRSQDAILTNEEASAIEDYEGYLYYPSPLSETPANGRSVRPQLPLVGSSAFKTESLPIPSQYGTAYNYFGPSSERQHANPERRHSVKEESDDSCAGFSWFQYPEINRHPHSNTLLSNAATPRGCGRFQGVETSRGYYPVAPAL